jgi:hypothetical protein
MPVKKQTAKKPANVGTTAQKIADTRYSEIMRNLEDVESYIQKAIDLIEKTYSMIDFPEKRPNNRVGHGVRNYGFIEKCKELMKDNPKTVPTPEFEKDFLTALNEFDRVRQICLLTDELDRVIKDAEVMFGNQSLHEALNYYNYMKSLARMKRLDAEALVKSLEKYFKRKPGVIVRPEPTKKQLLKDVKAIIKGHKDGKIVIENFTPKHEEVLKKVVDKTYKPTEYDYELLEEIVDNHKMK